jgi:hypothetical protein
MMNYCNGIQSFINYALSNLKNFSGESIRCPCKSCKNKKFLDPNIITMHLLQKRFMKKHLCGYTHEEAYDPHNKGWTHFG